MYRKRFFPHFVEDEKKLEQLKNATKTKAKIVEFEEGRRITIP
jgi:hypothetical protein